MSEWTRMDADWQPLPSIISRDLPICPLCKQRPEWEVHEKFAWKTRGHRIVCNLCGAEWEYTSSKPLDMIYGGATAAMERAEKKITNDNSVWILKKAGNSQNGSQLLEKEITFSTWKRMTGTFCGNCGKPLAINEKFCLRCGQKRTE